MVELAQPEEADPQFPRMLSYSAFPTTLEGNEGLLEASLV